MGRKELTDELHPHLELEKTMIPTPKISPGDFVAWHCDAIHSVDKVHNETGTFQPVKANLGTSADRSKICCVAELTGLDNKLLVSLKSEFGMVLFLARDGQLSRQTPSWDSDVMR
ncbi:hypothetical protein E4U58_000218 [Claviceps cyperi]|nr:hypothetical protein E4U58_000218 [Claviceps cyperi]